MCRHGQNPKPAGVEIIDYGSIKKTVRSAWETTKKIGKRLGAEEITVLVEDLNGGVDHANDIKRARGYSTVRRDGAGEAHTWKTWQRIPSAGDAIDRRAGAGRTQICWV